MIEKEQEEAQAEIAAARAAAVRVQEALEEQAHALSKAEQEVSSFRQSPSSDSTHK